MRILLTNPFCWPYVRRGVERFQAELADYLLSCGHDVTILTSRPGSREIDRSGPTVVVRESQIDLAPLRWAGITPQTTFLVRCSQFLRKHDFDVVHCLHYADPFGACLNGLPRRTALIVHMMGMPFARWVRKQPWESLILRTVVRRATRFVVISRAAELSFRSIFNRSSVLLPMPCDTRVFALCEGRDLDRPRILGVGDFSERRKGAVLLARAFDLVKKRVPGAVLQYSGNMPEEVKNRVLQSLSKATPTDVQFLGIGTLEDLPSVYGQAAVTALPSVGEAFGMVLVESLACGTPVVGSRDGGIPDIIKDGTGILFDPGGDRHEPANAEGLADAILKALCLYSEVRIHQRCRERAEYFSWERLGPQFEDLYYRAVDDCTVSRGDARG